MSISEAQYNNNETLRGKLPLAWIVATAMPTALMAIAIAANSDEPGMDQFRPVVQVALGWFSFPIWLVAILVLSATTFMIGMPKLSGLKRVIFVASLFILYVLTSAIFLPFDFFISRLSSAGLVTIPQWPKWALLSALLYVIPIVCNEGGMDIDTPPP